METDGRLGKIEVEQPVFLSNYLLVFVQRAHVLLGSVKHVDVTKLRVLIGMRCPSTVPWEYPKAYKTHIESVLAIHGSGNPTVWDATEPPHSPIYPWREGISTSPSLTACYRDIRPPLPTYTLLILMEHSSCSLGQCMG